MGDRQGIQSFALRAYPEILRIDIRDVTLPLPSEVKNKWGSVRYREPVRRQASLQKIQAKLEAADHKRQVALRIGSRHTLHSQQTAVCCLDSHQTRRAATAQSCRVSRQTLVACVCPGASAVGDGTCQAPTRQAEPGPLAEAEGTAH